MKLFTPEISWHNRLPALALDIEPSQGTSHRLATGGTDCRVYIWSIDMKGQTPVITIKAGLRRHMKSVGAVRFSGNGLLASGDDDGYIYIWKYHEETVDPSPAHIEEVVHDNFNDEDGFHDKETWKQVRVLRGHLEDICDIAWSKDGQFLLSGSIDNSAILWDALKGCKLWCSTAKGYVQGVAIDPLGQYMAAMGSDRTLRVFNFQDKRQLYANRRMNINKGANKAIFSDDTVQTFCRRLDFTPDGQYLIAPTSKIVENKIEPKVDNKLETKVENDADANVMKDEPVTKNDIIEIDLAEREDKEVGTKQQDEDVAPAKKPVKSKNAILVFSVNSFSKPLYYYTTGREPALCVRCSPKVYKLRDDNTSNLWGKPYRMIFAVATTRSVIIYDTQQVTPIAYASQMHLARLTDLAWSSDGINLMIASYDGYCTIMQFDDVIGEEGEIPPPEEPKKLDVSMEEPKKGTKRPKVQPVPKENPIKKEKVDIRSFLINN